MTVKYTPIHQAVVLLAGVCDFASSEDGVHYSGTDAWVTHALSDIPAEQWTEEMALLAWWMTCKYREQLAGFGLNQTSIPRPPGAEDLIAEREGGESRFLDSTYACARDQIGELRERTRSGLPFHLSCENVDADVFLYSSGYLPPLAAGAKSIKGWSFQKETQTYRFPFHKLAAVIALADRHDINVPAEVRALVDIADHDQAEIQADEAKMQKLRANRPNVYLDAEGRLTVAADWDPALHAEFRDLTGGTSTWVWGRHVWQPPTYNPFGLRDIFKRYELIVSDEVEKYFADLEVEWEINRREARQLIAEAFHIPGLAPGEQLLPHQFSAVRFMVKHERTFCLDEMGYCKTTSALAAIAVKEAYPAVVVAPASLVPNWQKETARFFPYLEVFVCEGQTTRPIPPGTDLVVISSTSLGYVDKEATGDGERVFPWVSVIEKIRPLALIIDEGHESKEDLANRTTALKALSPPIIDRKGMVLNLTGTPAPNRYRELGPPIEIMGRMDEFGGPQAYYWRYCLSETNRRGAKYDGSRNGAELYDRLISSGLMIRRSDDAALGLPPCNQVELRVELSELDPKVMAEYFEAEADVVKYMGRKVEKIAKSLGLDPHDERIKAELKASSAENLVLINTLTELVGRAKRTYAEKWIRNQINDGNKVVVVAHQRAEVSHYAKLFGGLRIQGGQTAASKEDHKAKFQTLSVKDAPVISLSIMAGAVGHTLHAAHIGLQVETTWVYGDRQQAMRRIHRVGQENEVFYYLLIAADTVDEYKHLVVEEKKKKIEVAIDGFPEAQVESEVSAVTDVSWLLAQRALRGTGGRA